MKYIPLFASIAWAAFIILSSIFSPTHEIIGEGDILLLISATPIALFGIIHSFFLGRPSKFLLLYSTGVAITIPSLYFVYRIHLGFTSEDITEGLLSLAFSLLVFFIYSSFVYLVPFVRYRLFTKTEQGAPANL